MRSTRCRCHTNGNTKWTRFILENEDINAIIYEVVNAKAASPENQGKRAPIPTKRKRKCQKQAES